MGTKFDKINWYEKEIKTNKEKLIECEKKIKKLESEKQTLNVKEELVTKKYWLQIYKDRIRTFADRIDELSK